MMPFPQSRFGAVPMAMIRRRSADDWQPELFTTTFHFPGGNVNETQVTGRGVFRLACMVRMESSTAFEQFEAMLGSRQTLRMLQMATAYSGDRVISEFGEVYKEFDGVLLNAPLRDITLHIGGQVDVTATFERDPKP